MDCLETDCDNSETKFRLKISVVICLLSVLLMSTMCSLILLLAVFPAQDWLLSPSDQHLIAKGMSSLFCDSQEVTLAPAQTIPADKPYGHRHNDGILAFWFLSLPNIEKFRRYSNFTSKHVVHTSPSPEFATFAYYSFFLLTGSEILLHYNCAESGDTVEVLVFSGAEHYNCFLQNSHYHLSNIPVICDIENYSYCDEECASAPFQITTIEDARYYIILKPHAANLKDVVKFNSSVFLKKNNYNLENPYSTCDLTKNSSFGENCLLPINVTRNTYLVLSRVANVAYSNPIEVITSCRPRISMYISLLFLLPFGLILFAMVVIYLLVGRMAKVVIGAEDAINNSPYSRIGYSDPNCGFVEEVTNACPYTIPPSYEQALNDSLDSSPPPYDNDTNNII